MLAAGAGTRLHPLTRLLPKALCPLGDRALLDHALGQFPSTPGATGHDPPRRRVEDLAVNVHHGAEAIIEHLEARGFESGELEAAAAVHVSHERQAPLGTAGAVGNLRGWLDGRDLVVLNADTWIAGPRGRAVTRLLEVWDGERVAVLTDTPGVFGPRSSVVASVLPWAAARSLGSDPQGLWEALWAREVAVGRLQAVHTELVALDCGTPARYLVANLFWARERAPHGELDAAWIHPDAVVNGRVSASVVGAGAMVDGTVGDCVVWPGARVHSGETLQRAIRGGGRTVLVR